MDLQARYRFVDNLAAYAHSVDQGACEQCFPVLAPANPMRRERFARILAWYGLQETTADHGEARTDFIHAGRFYASERCVVVPDAHLEAHGRLLARVFQAELWAGREAQDLWHDVRLPTRIRSVTFVVGAEQCRGAVIERLARLNVPWSLVTGIDAAGISFHVAKLIANRHLPRPARIVSLDASGDSMHVAGQEGLRPDEDLHAVLERDVTFVLHAHGDGAHAKLGSAVLCGRIGKHELNADATPLSQGCATTEQGAYCKRSSGCKVLLASELRVRRMWLSSCNGAALAGEGYPSDSSLLLAALEGHACEILSIDRPARIVDGAFALLRSCHADVAPLPFLGWLLGARANRCEEECYVATGVAEPAEASVARLTSARTLSTVPTSATAVRLEPVSPLVGVLRARGLVWLHARTSASDPVDLARFAVTDVSATLEAWHRQWSLLSRRAARQRETEGQLEQTFLNLYERDAVALKAHLAVVEARALITRYLDRISTLLIRAARAGVLSRELEALQLACAEVVGQWDQAFARLLNDHLLGHAFGGMWEREGPRSDAGRCERDGTLLRASVEAGETRSWCRLCGFREAFSEERLTVQLPHSLAAGRPIGVRAAFSRTAPLPDALASLSTQLAVQLRDSGRMVLAARHHAVAPTGAHDVVLSVPDWLTPDLHTFYVAGVRALDWSVLRLRRPGHALPREVALQASESLPRRQVVP